MKVKIVLVSIITCSIILNLIQFAYGQLLIMPHGFNNAVPDKETALKIAEAVWIPIYGEEIYNSKPFQVEFDARKKTWLVYGTLPDDYVGGVPEIEIRKKDGQITYINHGM